MNKATLATQVCFRCKTQKRKCDKVLPVCSLCKRLGHKCFYEAPASQSSLVAPYSESSTFRQSESSETLPSISQFSESHLTTALVQQLSGKPFKDIVSLYNEAIHTWFPIISTSHLQVRLPSNWENIDSALTLLLASIILVTAIPTSSTPQFWKDLQDVYHLCKLLLGLLDACGKNSLGLLQARILIVLYETGHGLYLAAYISIGALVRAADALEVFSNPRASILRGQTAQEYALEVTHLWKGILILDRAIALENITFPAVTKHRSFPRLNASCKSHLPDDILSAFEEVYIASNFLEKVQNTVIYQDERAKHQASFTFEEISLITQRKFPTFVLEQGDSDLKPICESWPIFTSALLLLYIHGTGVLLNEEHDNLPVKKMAQTYLDTLLQQIATVMSIITEVKATVDFKVTSPFVLHTLYKAASILTDRIRIGDSSKTDLDNLRVFRKMIKFLSERWLVGERYLKLLDDDTTLKMARDLELESS